MEPYPIGGCDSLSCLSTIGVPGLVFEIVTLLWG
jgi:hypothetical protein